MALEEYDDTDEFSARRKALTQRYGLEVGGGLWIGHSGIPCEALLAVLRMQHASADDYPLLEARGPFIRLGLNVEQEVIETVRLGIHAVQGASFSTSMEDDMKVICREDVSRRDGGSDDGRQLQRTDPRVLLALKLRVEQKKICHRCLEWCDRAIESLLEK
jgi:hypothetical protein